MLLSLLSFIYHPNAACCLILNIHFGFPKLNKLRHEQRIFLESLVKITPLFLSVPMPVKTT
jgi:hypothetical protein